MRKLSLFAVVMTLVPAGTAAWIAAITHANVEAPMHFQIDQLQLTRDAGSLPIERGVDYSLIFE